MQLVRLEQILTSYVSDLLISACKHLDMQAEMDLKDEMALLMPYVTTDAFIHLLEHVCLTDIFSAPSLFLGGVPTQYIDAPLKTQEADGWRADDSDEVRPYLKIHVM